MDRSGQQPLKHDPRMSGQQPTPSDVYTYANAVADCPTHRAQHQQAEARHAENGASMARRDRLTLGLRTARTTAVTL